MSAVVELFGYSAEKKRRDWSRIVQAQQCPFLGKKCYKLFIRSIKTLKTEFSEEPLRFAWECIFKQ